MNEPKFLSSGDYQKESLQYDFLLAKGIELIQQFSGQNWTDYNYHDPGITLLEQLCYALTDLAYRTNFPIEDILIANQDNFDLEHNNMLFPPDKIFSSAPLTLFDFRKIILDEVDLVNNAWVTEVKDNKYGFKGLYDVLVECNEDADTNVKAAIKRKIKKILYANRSLGTDINEIKILQEDKITISGDIELNSYVLAENILADIYYRIETLLNPVIPQYELESMTKAGDNLSTIFSGPKAVNGFYKPNTLPDKTNEFYVSDLEDLILNTEGVINLENFQIFKNGIHIFDDMIAFESDRIPNLEKVIHNYNTADQKLNFYRNNTRYDIDTVIVSQLYDSLALSAKQNYFKKIQNFKLDITSRFPKEEIEKYYSIQKELPAIYGLKQGELPVQSSKKRIAQMKQLKAYLSIFEQIMADHLSQLANVRNIFSIDPNISTTYFKQKPEDIPDVASILMEGEDLEGYLSNLKRNSETPAKFYKRRNQILDHMLARFGELFDTTILGKIMQAHDTYESENEVQTHMLNAKIKYAENIVSLGANRVKACDYSTTIWEKENISGLEKRLKLLLDIKDFSVKSTVAPLMESYQKLDKEDKEWGIETLETTQGQSLTVFSSNTKNTDTEGLNFYCSDYDSFKALFLFAHRKKNYAITSIVSKDSSRYALLFNSPNHEYPVNTYQSNSYEECLQMRDKSIERFNMLNVKCESFFMIEHLMLRPLEIRNYQIYFYDDQGDECLRGFESGDFQEQRNFRDDIYIIGTDPDNYSIQSRDKEDEFEIVIFDILNMPVFKSPKIYTTKKEAKTAIDATVKFLNDKKNTNTDLESFSKIHLEDELNHEFPNDFQYSNKVSFFIPDWPFRMQKREFISLFQEHLSTFIPAHLNHDIFILDVQKMNQFEDAYMNWLNSKLNADNKNIDLLSLQLIQLIMSFNPN